MSKTKRNKTVAGILAILFGSLGVQYFYLGKIGKGVACILFCWTGIPAIIGLIVGIMYLTDSEYEFHKRYGAIDEVSSTQYTPGQQGFQQPVGTGAGMAANVFQQQYNQAQQQAQQAYQQAMAQGAAMQQQYQQQAQQYQQQYAQPQQQYAQPQQPAGQGPKFCTSCGAPLQPGQKFCTSCGSRL